MTSFPGVGQFDVTLSDNAGDRIFPGSANRRCYCWNCDPSAITERCLRWPYPLANYARRYQAQLIDYLVVAPGWAVAAMFKFATIVPPVIILQVVSWITSLNNQTLHDRAVGTVVVRLK